MGTTVRVLLLFAMVGLAGVPAQAHMIGIRGGGGSEDVCDETTPWLPLVASSEFSGFFEAAYFNNCGVNIFSIDFQLSPDGDGISHPPSGADPFVDSGEPPNIFNMVTPGMGAFGPVYRFFSSEGNDIGGETECFDCTIGPFFLFYVFPDGDPGFVRIVGINQVEVVPEPATLLLLGSGLGAALLKRRRRR